MAFPDVEGVKNQRGKWEKNKTNFISLKGNNTYFIFIEGNKTYFEGNKT